MTEVETLPEEPEKEEFAGLLKFTATGFLGGFLVGILLDSFGFQRSAIGQWIVRTLSGEGESIFEGIYALRQRVRRAPRSMAEAYGWGNFLEWQPHGSSIGEVGS